MLEPCEERQFLPEEPRTQIGSLKPGIRNIHCTFIILEKGKISLYYFLKFIFRACQTSE